MATVAKSPGAVAADKDWRALIEQLLPVGAQVAELWPEVDDDPLLRADLLWLLYSEIGAGFMTVAYANDHHPDWYPFAGDRVLPN